MNIMILIFQKLTGAVNDANRYLWKIKRLRKFDITRNHFLTNESATYMAIRQAISDLLFQTDSSDIALFYFSGHGFRDGRGNGYIAPYDMKKKGTFRSWYKYART